MTAEALAKVSNRRLIWAWFTQSTDDGYPTLEAYVDRLGHEVGGLGKRRGHSEDGGYIVPKVPLHSYLFTMCYVRLPLYGGLTDQPMNII